MRVAVEIGVVMLMGCFTSAVEAAPGEAAAMDQLVDHTCGSNPLERKIAARLDRAKLNERAVLAVKKCTGKEGKLDVGIPLPFKALPKLDVQAEAAFRECLNKEKVTDPEVVNTLTSYVRAAFEGNESDRKMQNEYASCYADVLRCKQHPCPGRANSKEKQARASTSPLRLSVKVLAATEGQSRFLPVAADRALHSRDKVVFQVTTSRPAFVYIVQKTAARGHLRVLFPDPLIPLRNPLRGTALRLPQHDHFVLDDEVGQETVFVVASEHEQVDLAARVERARQAAQNAAADSVDDERALGQALAQIGRGGKRSSPDDGSVADGKDAVTRGLTLAARLIPDSSIAKSPDGPTAVAEVSPGDDTLVIQLGFTHLAIAAR